MGNPLDTLNVAAGAEALPLELLQPLDSSNPASTPVRLSGPEQRLNVTPDPGVDNAALLPPSQLLIGKDGATRSIWPVHLAGWQALGWQLLSPASGGDEPVPVDSGDNAPEPELADALDLEPEQPAATEPASAPDEPTPTDEPLETTADGGEALGKQVRADNKNGEDRHGRGCAGRDGGDGPPRQHRHLRAQQFGRNAPQRSRFGFNAREALNDGDVAQRI